MVFKFIDAQQAKPVNCNLTEIQAAEFAAKGFMGQNDWVAHMLRYGFIQKTAERVKPETILDIGCGQVQLPYFLWRNRSTWKGNYIGIDARATESWPSVINSNSAFKSFTLVRGDVLSNPSSFECFGLKPPYDFVVCFEVLEHIPNAVKRDFAQILAQWVSVGGHLYLSSPNTGMSDTVAKNHIGPDGIREMSYMDKVRMFESSGFVQEKAYGTYMRKKYVDKSSMSESDCMREEYLTYPMYSAIAAIPHPVLATNALHVFKRTA